MNGVGPNSSHIPQATNQDHPDGAAAPLLAQGSNGSFWLRQTSGEDAENQPIEEWLLSDPFSAESSSEAERKEVNSGLTQRALTSGYFAENQSPNDPALANINACFGVTELEEPCSLQTTADWFTSRQGYHQLCDEVDVSIFVSDQANEPPSHVNEQQDTPSLSPPPIEAFAEPEIKLVKNWLLRNQAYLTGVDAEALDKVVSSAELTSVLEGLVRDNPPPAGANSRSVALVADKLNALYQAWKQENTEKKWVDYKKAAAINTGFMGHVGAYAKHYSSPVAKSINEAAKALGKLTVSSLREGRADKAAGINFDDKRLPENRIDKGPLILLDLDENYWAALNIGPEGDFNQAAAQKLFGVKTIYLSPERAEVIKKAQDAGIKIEVSTNGPWPKSNIIEVFAENGIKIDAKDIRNKLDHPLSSKPKDIRRTQPYQSVSLFDDKWHNDPIGQFRRDPIYRGYTIHTYSISKEGSDAWVDDVKAIIEKHQPQRATTET